MRRTYVQAALLGVFVVLTLPPLVVLCRGRSPSRFSSVNLPVWERKSPHFARARAALRALPLPPNKVQFDKSIVRPLQKADENRLLAGIESPGKQPSSTAGNAGAWLESACALGRQDRALSAKQDRVVLRLMTAEDADGYLAAGQKRGRWAASQVQAESRNLRGLLACYAVTHRVAVIYAAMQAGDLVVSAPELGAIIPRPPFSPPGQTKVRPFPPVQTAGLVLPMTRLYLMTGQERYRQWALHQAKTGRADAAGLCELYLATGQVLFLRQAQELWKQSATQGVPDPDAASCLLAMTGTPGYAHALRTCPAPWPCPLSAGSLAFTQTPQGLSVNTWANARFVWRGCQWAQRTAKNAGGLTQTTVTAAAKQPCKAMLSFPTAGASITADVNHTSLLVRKGQAMLSVARVWRGGDRVLLTALPGPASLQTSPRSRSAVPLSAKR